jgi:rhamnosyl/mannosyltransferase
MNILHIYKDYYPVLGGIENHIAATSGVARGHNVTVLVPIVIGTRGAKS